MVKQSNKEKLSITLDKDVFLVISEEAEKDDRTLSAMINKILKDWVKDKETK